MLDQAGNTSQVDRTVGIDTRPPSLDVSFNGTNGQNGWYLSAGVSAATSDPLPGSGSSELQYSLNSGAWTTFSGSYTFPDGTNTVDFRAVDLAENTAQAAAPITTKVDSTDPVIDTNITGTPGKNGWYISTASVSGSAVDATSGLSTLESNLDSGGWLAYGSPISITDGSHAVSFYAEDAAGQSAQTDLTLNVDTHAPQIGASISAGTAGQNGWYISPVTLNGTASDPTPGSGLASFTASVDGGAPADGSAPISLTDGQHVIVFDAEDTAGLTASLTRSINIDSAPPSLTVDTSLPVWNRGSVSFAGSAADALSGLARVEISTDNSLTWQSAAGGSTWLSTSGSNDWTVDWDTTTADDGDRVVRIRSVDTAGLTTESAFYVGVDNHGPQISAPSSWDVHDSVTLTAIDAGSGVDEVVVKISDPYNRYPTRVLQYEGGSFPLAFTWDRHFEDGTLAPHGEYTVLITAADNFGNESVLNAKVSVPLIGHIFGGYNTATPMPTLLPTLTPTPRGTAPTLAPTSTLAATELAFGVPVTGTGAGGTSPSAPASPAQRSGPPSLGFTSFIQDVFFPASGSTVVETSTSSPAAQPLSAASAGVLFGSAATAATTGLAAYYLQKKKEEEEARREAILAKIEAEKAAEERRERIEERIRQQEAIAAAKAAKKAPVVYASAATTQTKTQTQMQTKVVYMREKADPTFENITGKPSMSMSDALKITHPQTKTTTKTKTNKVVYNREKYDTSIERKTETEKTWNATDGVIPVSTSKTGNDSSSILGGIRDDVCYAPGYGNNKNDPTDPLGIKRDDVCYAPVANNSNKGSNDESGEKRDDVCYDSDYEKDKEEDSLLIPFKDLSSQSSTLGNTAIQYPPFIKYGPPLPEPAHTETINPVSSQPFGLEQYRITMDIVKYHPYPIVDYSTVSIGGNFFGFALIMDRYNNLYLGLSLSTDKLLGFSWTSGYLDRKPDYVPSEEDIRKTLFGPSINWTIGLGLGYSKGTSPSHEEGFYTPVIGPSFTIVFPLGGE